MNRTRGMFQFPIMSVFQGKPCCTIFSFLKSFIRILFITLGSSQVPYRYNSLLNIKCQPQLLHLVSFQIQSLPLIVTFCNITGSFVLLHVEVCEGKYKSFYLVTYIIIITVFCKNIHNIRDMKAISFFSLYLRLVLTCWIFTFIL